MTDEPTTLVGGASRIAERLLTALPPAFITMVVLNIIFLAIVMWFLNTQMEVRTALIEKVLDGCIANEAHYK